MEINGQFYLCKGCGKWQPFMGKNTTICDCGYNNEFTDDELDKLEEAAKKADDEYDW